MLRQHTVNDVIRDGAEAFRRLRGSDEAEWVVEDGRPVAVMMSPEVFERLVGESVSLTDLEGVRESHEQYRRGECRDGFEALAELRQKITELPRS
jgi:hypothetical protein